MGTSSMSSAVVQFAGTHCTLEISRPAEGVVLIVIKGRDTGQFRDAPFRELAKEIAMGLPFEVFVDASAVPSASIEVSGSWARWMMANRDSIQRFNIFCRSRFVEITANFVRQFTEFGPRMRVYTDASSFETAFRVATFA
jgi:hypothetical protein